MNKQMIEELVEKAIASIPQGAYEIPDSFCEKFAELIVKECASEAFEYWCGPDGEGNSAEDHILAHFGVGQ